jgi:hypothetical protein
MFRGDLPGFDLRELLHLQPVVRVAVLHGGEPGEGQRVGLQVGVTNVGG